MILLLHNISMNSIMENPIMKRENFVDTAKGIGLFLVVMGHLVHFQGVAFTWIFSFHMMLFFFISGYQFDSQKYKDKGFSEFFNKKAKNLLIPYVIISTIGKIICMVIPAWRDPSKDIYYSLMYLTQPEGLKVGQIWFLICLFITEIMFFYLYKKFFQHLSFTSIIFITVFISIVGYGMNEVRIFQDQRLPWKLDSAITALVFYIIGFCFRKSGVINKLFSNVIYRLVSIIIIIISGTASLYISLYLNGYVNICDCYYGNYFYFYLAAFSGIIFILLISKFLENIIPLRYYGKNTLWMFVFHSYFLYISVYILNYVTKKQYIRMDNIPFYYCIIMSVLIYLALGLIPLMINCGKSLYNRLVTNKK